MRGFVGWKLDLVAGRDINGYSIGGHTYTTTHYTHAIQPKSPPARLNNQIVFLIESPPESQGYHVCNLTEPE